MNIEKVNIVFFIGIGGIGMSALARYFSYNKKKVFGYDKTNTELTSALESENINIFYDDNISRLSSEITPENTIVIYTPAIPKDNLLFNYFKSSNFLIFKRSEALGEITQNMKTIAISGTHGKTTVTSIVSHILNNSTLKCNAFLGGISKNFNSNFIASDSELAVVEADEFDRSFLCLSPFCAAITSVDADHLDIYGEYSNVVKSFEDFICKINKNGFLLINKKVKLNIPNYLKSYTYSIEDNSDYQAINIRIIENKLYFDIKTPTSIVKNIELGIPGRINIENSIVAYAIAENLGIEKNIIVYSLKTFKGVVRRFDYHVNNDKYVYIDDYAHHPEELKASISSIKELYANKKLTGIFQPHLYSRTRDFADEFAKSLSLLDELILLEIYPARELPIEGISSKIIFDEVKLSNKILCEKSQLLDILKSMKIEVLMTLGAGDIDNFVNPIKDLLNNN